MFNECQQNNQPLVQTWERCENNSNVDQDFCDSDTKISYLILIVVLMLVGEYPVLALFTPLKLKCLFM